MKYLKFYEAFKQENEFLLIVEKGTELFHGTVEPYDKQDARPGGYDSVFWTTDSSAISQTYIPISSKIFIDTETLTKPIKEKHDRSIQIQLGIHFDYDSVEWSEFNGHPPKGYKTAPEFAEFYEIYYKNREELNKLRQEYDALKIKLVNDKELLKPENRELRRSEMVKLSNMESVIKEKENKYYNDESLETLKNNYVNNKLKEYGYEPTGKNDSHDNYSWRLKYSYENEKVILQRADYKSPGRLFIVTPKRDLRIKDYTMGGEREADLTDEDYHKINWFRMAEEKGYDGVRITDHCQSDDHGNVGHLSIGLFHSTLKDVDIDEIPAVHRELEPHFQSRDWHTDEYKEYKSKK